MSQKIIVSPTADMRKSTEAFAQLVADKLGVCVEDVIVLPSVAFLAVVEIPAEMIEAKAEAKAEANTESVPEETAVE